MLTVDIPGRERLELAHLVLDYNGTLALDGRLLPGVAARVCFLAEHLQVHVITADTYGGAAKELEGLPVTLQVIQPGDQAGQKAALVERLGAHAVCALGNGANDFRMLERAALGICVLGDEGVATQTLLRSDVVVDDPVAGFDLLLKTDRLKATLRI